MAPILGAVALAVVAVLVTLAALGLLVAAAVAALIPHVGLAGALAIIGLALLALVAGLALVIRANLRAAQDRARTAAAVANIAKLAMVLLPKPSALRVAGGLQLGLGLALILLPMLRRRKG
jgi:hypothetical protein